MIEYVVVYPYTVEQNNTRLPLILKKQPPHLEGMLNLPGGKINPGEHPVDAGVRELKEETGLEQVSEYDPMCYCPAEHLGVIQGTRCVIHCVRVPISMRQELNPSPGEIEEVRWFPFPDLLNLPNLMPNLRVVIPLMDRGAKDWKLEDFDGNWRKKVYHMVNLLFKDMESSPLQIRVKSVGHYTWEEEE